MGILYEYKCENCGRKVTDIRKEKDKDDPVTPCPLCCDDPHYERQLPAPPNTGDKGKGRWGRI